MRSPTKTGRGNSNEFTATVTTRPFARRKAAMLAAMSTCDMIQPPKMSPAKLVSVGMAKTRSVGSRSCGRHELIIRRFLAKKTQKKPGDDTNEKREEARTAHLQGW